MKVLLDIKEAKAPFVLELLKSFSFVKTTEITPYKAEIIEGLKEAVDEVHLIEAGKLEARNAEELFDEL